MKQITISVNTKGRGLIDITKQVSLCIPQDMNIGLCHVFIQHTSASLLITENASHEVPKDIEEFFNRLIPDSHTMYQHDIEGPDDMPSHLRSILTQTALSIPIQNGRLALGTWQGIFLYEHRLMGHSRTIIITFMP